jgi:hypothetical protein
VAALVGDALVGCKTPAALTVIGTLRMLVPSVFDVVMFNANVPAVEPAL